MVIHLLTYMSIISPRNTSTFGAAGSPVWNLLKQASYTGGYPKSSVVARPATTVLDDPLPPMVTPQTGYLGGMWGMES